MNCTDRRWRQQSFTHKPTSHHNVNVDVGGGFKVLPPDNNVPEQKIKIHAHKKLQVLLFLAYFYQMILASLPIKKTTKRFGLSRYGASCRAFSSFCLWRHMTSDRLNASAMLCIECQLGQHLPSKDVINVFAKNKVPTEHNYTLDLFFSV